MGRRAAVSRSSATFRGKLADAVRKGRREEFSRFPEFADPGTGGEDPRSTRGIDIPFVQARLEPHRSRRIWPSIARCSPRAVSMSGRFCRTSSMAARRSCWASRRCASSGELETQRCSCSTPISRLAGVEFPPVGGPRVLALRRHGRRVRPLERALERSNPHDHSPRDLPAATARRLRLQRGGGDRALPRAARRQSCLSLAVLQGAARQRARLRHHRSQRS